MISVAISDPLAQAAIVQAKIYNRSIDNQINSEQVWHCAEGNPDLSFEFIKTVLEVRKEALTGQTEPYIFN
jgi:hypothetical protein